MGQNRDKLRVALSGYYDLGAEQMNGGVQAAVAALVHGLARLDEIELHVITRLKSTQAGPDRLAQDGATIHLLPPLPHFERLRGFPTYQRLLDDRLEQIRPQVIHAQGTAADAFVALRSGYPTIITVHGIVNEDRKHSRIFSERIRLLFDSLLIERRVVARTRYLIAISHYVSHYFSAITRADLRCFHIPNAVDERFFALDRAPVPQRVLFAGQVSHLKRVLDLVQAFELAARQYPAAQLHIAGDLNVDVDYVRLIRETICRAGLEKNVHLLGVLNQAQILDEFASCSLFVLPSAQESFSLVIAQAMASVRPVAAASVGGVLELLGEHGERGLLVPPGDVQSLAEAMLRLLQDAGLSQRLARSGSDFARQNFHPDVVARRTAEVYREVAARAAGSHD